MAHSLVSIKLRRDAWLAFLPSHLPPAPILGHTSPKAPPTSRHATADTRAPQARRDIAALEALVGGHDVVFLLMDTRESRWLPTLLCAALGRLAINAALGFDGFMVMRHGAPVPPEAEQLVAQQEEPPAAGGGEASGGGEPGGGGSGVPAAAPRPAPPPPSVVGSRLGCYFCNDVVAPINSTVDRTLDQQCTVARPGLSAIAGSLAAELMAAVVQQPAGAGAPAAGSPPAAAQQAAAGGEAPPLGHAPHMIRGQLGGFTQMCLTGQAFRQCTACSEAVVREYRRRGHDFLVQVGRPAGRLGLCEEGGWTRQRGQAEREVVGWQAKSRGACGPDTRFLVCHCGAFWPMLPLLLLLLPLPGGRAGLAGPQAPGRPYGAHRAAPRQRGGAGGLGLVRRRGGGAWGRVCRGRSGQQPRRAARCTNRSAAGGSGGRGGGGLGGAVTLV